METEFSQDIEVLEARVKSLKRIQPSVSFPDVVASTWSIYNPETWKPAPIGCLPGNNVPVLDLPPELDI